MEAEGAKVTVIDSRRSSSVLRSLRDVWEYRELLFFLVWKEIKIRYKQTAVGAAWAVLQPLIAMIVFWFLAYVGGFDKGTGDVPYPVFAYAGIVLWTYFASTLNMASNCLIANQALLTKVYFPRVLLPLAACLTGLVDYVIASIMMVFLMLVFGIVPTLWILLIFVPLGMVFLLGSGLGFWLSSVSAKYRDVHFIVPFFVQLLMFVSPVIIASDLFKEKGLDWINLINPVAPIINLQRFFVLGTDMPNVVIGSDVVPAWEPLVVAALISVAVFVLGLLYFNRYERRLADVI